MVSSSGEEEHRRFMGFPTSFAPGWQHGQESPGQEESRRFLGFPVSATPRGRPDLESPPGARRSSDGSHPSLRHPIVWVRWRIALHRHGPHTPDFNQFCRSSQRDAEPPAREP